MQTIINTHPFFGFNSNVIDQKQRLQCSYRTAPLPLQSSCSTTVISPRRAAAYKQRRTVCATTSSELEDANTSSCKTEDVLVTTSSTVNSNELKMNVEVSGEKTQAEFDIVLDKMEAAAQPIPGFRRTKGGKTPNIPRDILLEILGVSKVYKQVIKKIINSTISEYVEKEGLKVGKDLRVEQSYEHLEETFEPGHDFSFVAFVKLEESS